MKPEIQVRRYQISDTESIAHLYYDTIHAVNAKDYTQEQLNAWAPNRHDYKAWQEKCLNINPFVSLINGILVGFAEFESSGHIDCFYVHSKFQGCGIGSTLLYTIEAVAKEQGLRRIYAEVSITAKPFFEAKRFRVVKQQMVRIRDVELVNFIMEKCN